LWFSSVPPGEYRDSTLKLGHDRFLPNPFQFIIIHLSSYHRRYIVYLLKKRRKINYQPALPVSFQTWILYQLHNHE